MSNWAAEPSRHAVEAAAAMLDAQQGYRVLRRLVPLERGTDPSDRPAWLHGCAVSVETSGAVPGRDRVIALSMQRFSLGQAGGVIATSPRREWLEDPMTPLPEEVAATTGLTDEDVRGRRIEDADATSMLLSADFVVAYDAPFHRPWIEERLPVARGLAWACLATDAVWPPFDWCPSSLPALLASAGMFRDDIGSPGDVDAIVRLLDHRPGGEATIATRLLAGAARTTVVLSVRSASSAVSRTLRERGYRWDAVDRCWSIELPEDAVADEGARLRGSGPEEGMDFRCRRMDWTRRHAIR